MAKLPLLVAGRALALVAVLAALGAGAVDLARPPLAALMSTQGVAFDVALQALCAALLLAGWLWLQVAAAWLAVAAVPGRPAGPGWLRSPTGSPPGAPRPCCAGWCSPAAAWR